MKSPRTFPRLVMKEWPVKTENVCSWCGANAEEAAARHEGPHSTWCVHFRESQRGGLKDFTRVVDQTGILRSDSDKIAE